MDLNWRLANQIYHFSQPRLALELKKLQKSPFWPSKSPKTQTPTKLPKIYPFSIFFKISPFVYFLLEFQIVGTKTFINQIILEKNTKNNQKYKKKLVKIVKTQNLGYFLTFCKITIFIYKPISNKICYTHQNNCLLTGVVII